MGADGVGISTSAAGAPVKKAGLPSVKPPTAGKPEIRVRPKSDGMGLPSVKPPTAGKPEIQVRPRSDQPGKGLPSVKPPTAGKPEIRVRPVKPPKAGLADEGDDSKREKTKPKGGDGDVKGGDAKG